MVAYTHRFVPAASMAEELIAAGELGEPFTFQVNHVSACLADLSVPIMRIHRRVRLGSDRQLRRTKYATGRANVERIEMYGGKGGLVYSVERPGELEVWLGPAARDARQRSATAVSSRFGTSGMKCQLEACRLEQTRAFVDGPPSRTPVEPVFQTAWCVNRCWMRSPRPRRPQRGYRLSRSCVRAGRVVSSLS